VEKPASHSTESVEEKLARERAEAREELKHADMETFDRAIDALLKTGDRNGHNGATSMRRKPKRATKPNKATPTAEH